MKNCKTCGVLIQGTAIVDSKKIKLHKRRYCLQCHPYRQPFSVARFGISIENLTNTIKESYSIADLLKKFKMKPSGSNYKTIKKYVKLHNIDISHFTGQGHLKGKTYKYRPSFPLEDLLKENISYSSDKLRKRLISANYFQHKCYKCQNTEWQGQPIPIELEHINGDHTDNRLENLTILCPNCHAQTNTYRGKNKKAS